MSRWTFNVPFKQISGETKSGTPVNVVPNSRNGCYSTTDPSEADFLRSYAGVILVDYDGPAAPAPSLLAKGKHHA
jgi:hypothetical protein